MKKKVMIANYDPKVLRQQKKAFAGLDVEIMTVRDGDAVLSQFNEFKPDIILLDPMLPKVSGFDVAQQLRASLPELPIIMLTAVYRGLVYRTQALGKYGASEYLEEPVSAEKLRATIEKYIGSPEKKKKKKKVSSKKQLEKLFRDTKGADKSRKKVKQPAATKPEKVQSVAKSERASDPKPKRVKKQSTRKKLEAILKESHVH